MTIPSSLLIQEIMYYEGFSEKPVLNRVGMPSIGYGFPLWEEALDILHGNSKLARSIRNSMPSEQENMNLGMQRILALPLLVTEKSGRELLVQSLLYYAEELGKKFAGFRRLVNQCGEAVVYPQSSFAQYEELIALKNPAPEQPEKSAKDKKQKQYTNATKKQSMTFLQQLNSSERPLHPAFLQSFYSSSEAFAGANPFQSLNYFGKNKKKKNQKETTFFILTEREQALLRVDSVLFVTHLLGLDIVLHMHDFFLALQQDNFEEAASQLLSHRASGYFGAIMAILARRIREASLDYNDMELQKADFPKTIKRGRKPKNTFLTNFKKPGNSLLIQQVKIEQINFFSLCERGGQDGQRAGDVYGA